MHTHKELYHWVISLMYFPSVSVLLISDQFFLVYYHMLIQGLDSTYFMKSLRCFIRIILKGGGKQRVQWTVFKKSKEEMNNGGKKGTIWSSIGHKFEEGTIETKHKGTCIQGCMMKPFTVDGILNLNYITLKQTLNVLQSLIHLNFFLKCVTFYQIF